MGQKPELSPKRDRFCREYVIDHNGTQAAIRAGYAHKSAPQQAADLLTNPKVQARVQELEIPVADRLGLTHEYVLKSLQDVHDRCMQAVPVMVYNRQTKQMEETGEYTFDSQGANRALELIGKHRAMFTEKIDHTTKGKELKAIPAITVVDQATADVLKKAFENGIESVCHEHDSNL